MPYQSPEIRTFPGLFLQPNSLSVPDGAMEQALNVVINDDNVVQKLRGFYTYYDPSTLSLNALFVYQGKLLAAFATKLSYFTDTGSSPNITGTITDLGGLAVSITGTRRSRGLEQSGNFYLTTDGGVLKIDAYNASVYGSGIPPALDLRGSFDTANGVISGGNIVGYRVLFGRQDANGNVVLGAPSDIVVLNNSARTGLSYTSAGGGPYTVTVTDPSGHGLVTGMTVDVTSATDADANGTALTVTVTGLTTFTYERPSDPSSGTLTYTTSRKPIIEFSVPSEITSASDKYFYQVYRSSQGTTDPFPDFKLIAQEFLTTSQISARIVFYTDTIDDILVTYAPELYTNPNSREGESQANARAPLCDDMALFKDMVFYAGCTYRAQLDLDVIDSTVMSNGDYVETLVMIATAASYTSTGAGPYTVTVTSAAHGLTTGQSIFVKNASDTDANGAQTVTVLTSSTFTYSTASNPGSGTLDFGLVRRYVGRTGVGNTNVTADSATFVLTTITVNYTAHGLSTGDTIYVTNAKGTGTLPSGSYTITVTGANAFTFVAAATPTSLTTLSFQGVSNGTYPIFSLDASSSAAVRLRNTARGIVKAINRDTGSIIYANYVSGITDTPGQMRFTAKAFTGTIYVRASATAMAAGFAPVLPSAFDAGDQVFSVADDKPNVLAVSKLGEPEAVPIVNQVTVGSRNKAILRVVPLRDSLIVFKEDGVFKLNGQSPDTMVATILDNTVLIAASDSAVLINNQAYALTNQGVVSASDNAVEIISRRIENVIEPILGLSTLAAETGAVGYESDRTYRLSTVAPNSTSRSVTYLYNTINDTWTESDYLFKAGVVGPGNVLYVISSTGLLLRERKVGSKYDYCGQNYATTVTSVASDGLSAVVSTAATPKKGWIFVKNGTVSRVKAVSGSSGAWTLTFYRATNLAAADSTQIYAAVSSQVRFAPFHAGKVGLMKQFAQLQIHARQAGVTRLAVEFATQPFPGSEVTEWLASAVNGSSGTGWGLEPWGLFAWGDEDGINNVYTTQSAPVIRIWVPKFAQRSAWIQPILTHEEAGEDMQIQALAWSVRAYAERITK